MTEPRSTPPDGGPAGTAALRDALVFVACFALSVSALGALLPEWIEPMLQEKLEQLAEQPETYDTVFLGSSIVYRGYDPLAFDEATRELGLETTSFNLGIQGFAAADVRCALGHLERLELPRLRYALMQADRLIQPADLRYPLTGKAVAWHDLVTTMAALESVAALDEPLGSKLLMGYRNVVAFAFRSLHVGSGADWLNRVTGLTVRSADRRAWLGAAGRGHRVPEEAEGPVLVRQRALFLKGRDQYLAKVALQAREPRGPQPLGPWARRAFVELEEAFEALELEPVSVVAIRDEDGPSVRDACAEGLLGPTIQLDDPNEFPELYLPRHHFDRAHLNGPGAVVLSRLIAREFAGLVREGAVPVPAGAAAR